VSQATASFIGLLAAMFFTFHLRSIFGVVLDDPFERHAEDST